MSKLSISFNLNNLKVYGKLNLFTLVAVVMLSGKTWGDNWGKQAMIISTPNSCDNDSPLSLNNLSFLGYSTLKELAGNPINCNVIKSQNQKIPLNDKNAAKQCPGGLVINPGNPQYHKGEIIYGTLNESYSNFYYCIIGNENFRKHKLCGNLKTNRKSYSIPDYIKIEWKNQQDCMCSTDDGKSWNYFCPDITSVTPATPSPPTVAEASAAASAAATTVADTPSAACPPQLNLVEKAKCILEQCSKNSAISNQEICNKAENVLIDDCVSKEITDEMIKKCNDAVNAANSKCDTSKKDLKLANTLGSFTNVAGQIGSQMVKSQGSATACALTAGTAQTAGAVMKMLVDDCKTEAESCQTSCSEIVALTKKDSDQRKTLVNKCLLSISPKTEKQDEEKPAVGASAVRAAIVKNGKGERIESDPAYIINGTIDLKLSSVGANSISCAKAVETGSSWESIVANLATTAIQAQQCRCQFQSSTFAAAGVSNCDDTPSAEQCLANPSLAGCSVVQASTCMNDASSAACQALGITNPPIVSNIGGANGFATGAPTNSVKVGSMSGLDKLSASDLGLNSDLPNTKATGNGEDAGNPLGATVGAGGGGGGVGPSGGGVGGPQGGNPEENNSNGGGKSTLGGFFNAAKSGLMNMLGLGGSGGKQNNGSNGVNPQFNNGKPKSTLRGVATATQNDIATQSKNKRIWDIMSQQYKNQEHSLMPNE